MRGDANHRVCRGFTDVSRLDASCSDFGSLNLGFGQERHQRKFAHSDAWMMRGREEAVAHVNSALV